MKLEAKNAVYSTFQDPKDGLKKILLSLLISSLNTEGQESLNSKGSQRKYIYLILQESNE